MESTTTTTTAYTDAPTRQLVNLSAAWFELHATGHITMPTPSTLVRTGAAFHTGGSMSYPTAQVLAWVGAWFTATAHLDRSTRDAVTREALDDGDEAARRLSMQVTKDSDLR